MKTQWFSGGAVRPLRVSAQRAPGLLLFLDGVYVYRDNRPPRFCRVKAPEKAELEQLVQLISQRVRRCRERRGQL